MKVLLIDDSRTMRNIQKNVLKTFCEHECVEAGDGVEGLAAVAAAGGGAGFDLILVDWNMPNLDGLSFVKKFRETNKGTPVIMVTTEAEKTRIIDAIKAGVNNYVVKPFTPDSLLERIKQTLEKAKAAVAA
jgi:two-component system chemotaxis response regulator CheY